MSGKPTLIQSSSYSSSWLTSQCLSFVSTTKCPGACISPSNIRLTLNHCLQLFSTQPQKIRLRTSALLMRLAHASSVILLLFYVERARKKRKDTQTGLASQSFKPDPKETTTKCLRHHFHCHTNQTNHTKPTKAKHLPHDTLFHSNSNNTTSSIIQPLAQHVVFLSVTPHENVTTHSTCDNGSCTKRKMLLQQTQRTLHPDVCWLSSSKLWATSSNVTPTSLFSQTHTIDLKL